jgi:hypothetical protein
MRYLSSFDQLITGQIYKILLMCMPILFSLMIDTISGCHTSGGPRIAGCKK